MITLLRNAAFPVCFVESSIDGFDNVVINNESGGRLAAEYFYSKGCRNPAFIGEKSNKVYTVPATDDRFLGFKKFFSEKGICLTAFSVPVIWSRSVSCRRRKMLGCGFQRT